ncbi:MAG: SDR family oxidoreductase [Acidimicrobiia bacterium]|nr:SDR family oxidoreductase [Acidimicrobiia bacterium]
MTVALITGANSGIGRAAAVDLAAKGWQVYGSMRSLDKAAKLDAMAEEKGATVNKVVCDVTDTESVNRAVAEVTEASGGIDVMVNNAGIGGNGVAEETPIELYEEVMDVNLYGTIRCVQAVLPQMRERGSGCIINISSIAGRIAAIGQSSYVASKWALEGLTEGLAQEVVPQGIRVALIEPGIVKTAILAKNTDAPNTTGAYDAHYRRLFGFYAAGLKAPGHPGEVADVIHAAATDDPPKFRYTCGWGGKELSENRAKVSDADWIALGAIEDDAAYAARFEELFGLKIAE